MKLRTIVALLCVVPLSGCFSFIKDQHNNFRSNSYVGYVSPIDDSSQHEIRKGVGAKLVQNPNVRIGDVTKTDLIAKGECIAIELMDGYYHYASETSLEKFISKNNPRSELALSTAVYERTNSKTIEYDQNSKQPIGTEYNIMLFNGQLENRPFAFENYPVYGPRIYSGGDLTFEVTLVEKDAEEMESLRQTITSEAEDFAGRIKLEDNRMSSVKDTLVAVVTGSTLKVTGAGLIAFGADAMKLFAKTYSNINTPDDLLIKHSFSLTSKYRGGQLHSPLLRQGYYPLVRVSSKPIPPSNTLNGLKFDPVAPELEVPIDIGSATWLAFRVSKIDESMCK
ncbi:MAG: hypothetical protein AB2689_01905 [Candidatus Thiodiazotropha taylori]